MTDPTPEALAAARRINGVLIANEHGDTLFVDAVTGLSPFVMDAWAVDEHIARLRAALQKGTPDESNPQPPPSGKE